MSPARLLLAGTCAGDLLARVELRAGASLFFLFAALCAVAVVRSRP
ncbi:hypothetical protein [Corallococcus sp. RDP092CA]